MNGVVSDVCENKVWCEGVSAVLQAVFRVVMTPRGDRVGSGRRC